MFKKVAIVFTRGYRIQIRYNNRQEIYRNNRPYVFIIGVFKAIIHILFSDCVDHNVEYIFICSSAHFSHEKLLTRKLPRRISVSRYESSSMIFDMAWTMSSVLSGLKYIAASPATSGKQLASDNATGQRYCIASRIGMPNPS